MPPAGKGSAKKRSDTPGPGEYLGDKPTAEDFLRWEREAEQMIYQSMPKKKTSGHLPKGKPLAYLTSSVPQLPLSGGGSASMPYVQPPPPLPTVVAMELATQQDLTSELPAKAKKAASAKQPKASQPSSRRQRGNCCSMRVVSQTLGLFKWVRLPLLGMAILAGMKGNMETLVHVSRAVGASADVTVAVSDLAVQVLNRTSSGIAVVSTMVWAATSSSLGAVEASWHGLDLLNVTISRSRGRVQASSPKMLRRWLNSSTGQRVTLCRDAEVLQVWQDGLQSLQNGLSNLSHERAFLQIQGSFKRIAFQASWAGPDEAWMHYDVVGATFSPRWANPLWTFVELSWESESRQIVNLITELIRQLPST